MAKRNVNRDAKIVLLKEYNPKKKEHNGKPAKAYQRFELYFRADVITVQDFLNAASELEGRKPDYWLRDIYYDIEHGFITVGDTNEVKAEKPIAAPIEKEKKVVSSVLLDQFGKPFQFQF